MKTVYLIGNGFDLNLGLKSSYNDFYGFYKIQESDSYPVKNFKDNISNNIDKWSDLELALGEYTKEINSLDELDDIHENIVEELAEYLTLAQKKFTKEKISSINNEKFIEDLFHPEKFLLVRDAISLRKFFGGKDRRHNFYSIVNFNYTHTAEHILGLNNISNRNSNLKIEKKEDVGLHRLDSIFHVHGTIDSDMVIGVDNAEQIINKELSNNIDATNHLIKRDCNLVMRHGIESDCEKLISEADLICIFGSSIGETDQLWWDLIAEQLKERNCRLIVFEYLPSINKRRSQLLERRRRALLKKFIAPEELEAVSKRVYFSFNSEMFFLN